MRLGSTKRIRQALALAVCLAALPSCLWLPNFPIPDKIDPDPPRDDLPFAHCSPRPNKWEPVLVGALSGPRKIHCRIRGAESILWSLDTEVDEDDPILGLAPSLLQQSAPDLDGAPLILARNVESIELHREALPWSPGPYAALLRAAVALQNGEVTTKRWPIVVVPSADELVSTAGSSTEGDGDE